MSEFLYSFVSCRSIFLPVETIARPMDPDKRIGDGRGIGYEVPSDLAGEAGILRTGSGSWGVSSEYNLLRLC